MSKSINKKVSIFFSMNQFVVMSCIVLGRHLLRGVLEQVSRLPYRDYGRRLRWLLLTWICREFVKVLMNDGDVWDGLPTEEPIDALAEFRALRDLEGYKWSHFVIYLTWLTRTIGPERAYRVWRILENHHLKDLPSLFELAARLIVVKTCRNPNITARIVRPE